MKKIFFASAAVATCFFVSCKDEKSSANDAAETYKQKNAMIYKTIETGDTAGLKDWIASDAIDHGGAPDGSDVHSGDSIIAMLSQVHTAFLPGLKYTIINQTTDGDYLYVLAEMNGTTTGAPGMGMPPNTKMDMKSVDVIKIKDGHASEHWAFASPGDMMKMMGGDKGMMPPPPPGMMHDSMKMPMHDSAK